MTEGFQEEAPAAKEHSKENGGARLFLRRGLVRLRPLLHAVLYFLILAAAGLLTAPGVKALADGLHLSGNLRTGLTYVLANAGLLLLSALMLPHFDRRSFRALGVWFYGGWAREAAFGCGIGLLLIAATVGICVAGGWMRYAGFAQGTNPAGFFYVAVFLLLAAAFEELLFRGYIFQRLVDSLTPLGAILVTSAFFGIGHMNNPGNPGPLSTVNTILAGVLLSLAYLKTRALWLPIALHWSWNFFQGPIFSSPVSGFAMKPVLFRTEFAGANWQSGGTYGLEASVALTVTCTAAILWLWRTRAVETTPAMLDVSKEAEAS